MTEKDDTEKLIRVEQQLNNALQNQKQVIDDLKVIFGKIEKDAKRLSDTRSDSRLLEQKVNQVEIQNTKFEADVKSTIESLWTSINNTRDKQEKSLEEFREKQEKRFEPLETSAIELKTSVKNTRLFFGAIVGIATLVWAIIQIASKIKEIAPGG